MIARAAFALMLVAAATIVIPGEADACRPTSWECPLNGRHYAQCGPIPTPMIVQCTVDVVEDLKYIALP